MAHSLSEAATAEIRKTMDSATSDRNKVPGVVLAVVGKDGKPIFTHASGTRGIENDEPLTMDSIFWIASCTKMIAAIACMQLVEQGKLALDDPDIVEKLAPELKDVKILKTVDKNGKAEFVDRKNRITLKMLLTHTGNFTCNTCLSKLRQLLIANSGLFLHVFQR